MFKNYQTLTKATKWLLYVYMVAVFIAIFSMFKEYQLYAQLEVLQASMQSEQLDSLIANTESFSINVARIEFIIWLISGILVLCWIYRSNKNLELASKPLKISAGWAIGWYFIPIACLFKPYTSMQEIVQHSQNAPEQKGMKAAQLIGVWWFLWIFSGMLARFSAMKLIKAEDKTEYMNALQIGGVSELLTLGACIALLALINQVYRTQTANPDLNDILHSIKPKPSHPV